MKVRKLEDGETLEVGDRIKVDSFIGVRWETIHRVTPKFAFVRYNEVSEGKYRRDYRFFGFGPIPRSSWGTIIYSAWRPLNPP